MTGFYGDAGARRKATDAKSWTDTTQVPMGDEVHEFTFGLIANEDFFEIRDEMNLSAFKDEMDAEDGEHERLQELQQRDDLSDEEETEFQELAEEFADGADGVQESIGSETFNAVIKAGRLALEPTQEDVQSAMALSPSEQEEKFGTVLEGRTRDIRDLVRRDIIAVLEDCPYPVLFLVGQQAFAETTKLVGNAIQAD